MKALIFFFSLVFALLFISCDTTVPDDPLSHVDQKMAEAEHLDFARCGNVESAAFNELIEVHCDRDSITYAIPYIPETLDTLMVRKSIRSAYDQWAEIIQKPIVEVPAPADLSNTTADIVITFEWMDGIGGILGRADFPKMRNPQIITFDLYDMHEVNGELQFDFFTTALHEAGHSLGIPHLVDSEAVMWPAYRKAHSHLHRPDILKAKKRYGVDDSFTDNEGRNWVFIKKKTMPGSIRTSPEENSSHGVETSMAPGTSLTVH